MNPTIDEIMTTIRECMDDHGITVAQVAEWAGVKEATMRRKLRTGQIGYGLLTLIYQHTGDRRAFGIPKDYKLKGTLEAI